MARRRKEGTHISLLPILSIQKCAMGVMVVIVCAQNLVALGKSMAQQDDQILETGGVQDREAVYVECQARKILIHTPPMAQEVSLEEIRGPATSKYHQLLDDLQASKGKKYLVLLIRPEGVPTYDPCFQLAIARKQKDDDFQIGKEAVLSAGDLILTKDGKELLLRKAGR